MNKVHLPEINVDKSRVILVIVAIAGTLVLIFFFWLYKFTESNKAVSTETAEIVISTMIDLGEIPWRSDQSAPIAVIYCQGEDPVFIKSVNQFIGGEAVNCSYYNAIDVSPIAGGNLWDQSPRIYFRPSGAGE